MCISRPGGGHFASMYVNMDVLTAVTLISKIVTSDYGSDNN